MVINTDLTETKIAFEEMRRAEADARARASELEAILDAIPGATFIARDASCQTMTSSRAAYELLRLPPGANTSKPAPSIERPTSFQLVRNGREVEPAQLPVQQAAATGKPVINSELTIVFADGTSRDVLGNAVPLLNEDGTTRGAIGSFIDITERNAAIQSARRQEAILQSVLHDTSDFIFLKDSEGRYLAINPAGAKAAGKLPEDFLGKTDWEVFPVEVAEQHAKRDRAVLDSGKCASFEDHILYDGEMRHIQTLKNVCRDADGHVIGVVGITRDVTDQKLKEKQLAMERKPVSRAHRSQCKYRLDGKRQGFAKRRRSWLVRVDWSNSRGVCRQGGWPAIHPDDLERTVRVWQEHVASDEPVEMQHRVRRSDETYRTMLMRAVPVRDASNKIIEWVGIHNDITKQHLAEESRHRSESWFKCLFESDLMGIGVPDRFGAFLEGNDELLRITGYTREDLEAGRVRWDTMTPPEYRELDAAHIAEAAVRGSCTPYEKEYIRKDGVRIPIECGYSLIEGSQDVYLGFVQDLTERKRAEAEFGEREQRFRVLADTLPQLIWIANPEGENIYCNRQILEYYGFGPDAAAGISWWETVHTDDIVAATEAWKNSVQTVESFFQEFRLRRKDGQYRHFLTRAVPVRDDSGKIERWVGISTDVHDQKVMEIALRRSEKLAAAGRLAASIAHEINNPLESVTNSLYLAMQDRNLSEATRQYLRLAEQQLRRVAQVTTQTLRFHKQSTSPVAADLGQLMDSAISVFAQRLESASVTIKQEYTTKHKLYCYADELRQAFAHIISNAVDATVRGGRLQIRICEARDVNDSSTSGVRVVVADNGIGIPTNLRKHVLDVAVERTRTFSHNRR